jgi:4'-phosphopantetheinyl transferase
MTVEPERMTAKAAAAPRSAELWFVDLAGSGPALERQEREVPRLGRRDRAGIEALKPADVRQQRLTAHLALRVLCERHLGCAVRGLDLARPHNGKPRLPQPWGPFDFSLAHTEAAALIGVTRGAAIGVDLEEVRPVRIAGERRQRILTAGAALMPTAAIHGMSEAEAFMRAWVRLEALAKARGEGLQRTLAALGLRHATPGAKREVVLGVERQLSLTGLSVHDLALGAGLLAAVALDSRIALPPLNSFPVDSAGIEALLRGHDAG